MRLLSPRPSGVPARVRAAVAYARYCMYRTRRWGRIHEGEALSLGERATQAAALELLRAYFEGEVDFAPDRMEPPTEARGEPGPL